jgi:hypothetical protein
LRVGVIGCKFMGKTYSNAYRQIPVFFDPPVVPDSTRPGVAAAGWLL